MSEIVEVCMHCGREVKRFNYDRDHKIINGVCCFCLFKETKTKEILGLEIKPDGTAFEIINRLIEKINIPREQLYWFICKNKTAKAYLSLDGNYWHKDCMDNSPTISPEDILQRVILVRDMNDLEKLWSESEYLILKEKYENILK